MPTGYAPALGITADERSVSAYARSRMFATL